jgi:hypothetical protein
MLQKIILALAIICFVTCSQKKEERTVKAPAPATAGPSAEQKRLQTHAGSYRFYVYDFVKQKMIRKGLVTHGNCGESFLPEVRYGNTVGCNCSSLGKYKIGKKYYGRFGLAYKLHGLDKTNSKAYERFVVLHAHGCVPSEEVDPMPICQSNGCPTVAPDFLQTLSGYIDESEKPVLLWMFE